MLDILLSYFMYVLIYLVTVSLVGSELPEERSSILFIHEPQCLTKCWYTVGAQYMLAELLRFSWCIK